MYPLRNLFDQQLLDELAEVQLIDFTQDTQGRMHVWVELGSDVFAFECHLLALFVTALLFLLGGQPGAFLQEKPPRP
jgi:hypothetical protein